MRALRKILIFSALAMFVLGPTAALADQWGLQDTRTAAGLPDSVAGGKNVVDIASGVVAVLLSLVGIVFFGLAIFSGIYWMTARGDSSRVDKAKEMLESAIVGIIIVIGAYAISSFLFGSLTSGKDGKMCANDDECDKDTEWCSGGICVLRPACTNDGDCGESYLKCENNLCTGK